MSECVHLRTKILGANHPDTLSSFAAFTEWQIQEPKASSFATNRTVNTKGEPKRLDQASNHALHSGPRKKGLFDYAQAKISFVTCQLAICIGVLRLCFYFKNGDARAGKGRERFT